MAEPSYGAPATPADDAKPLAESESVTVPLMKLCIGRSGDKGDTGNVGIRARSPEIRRSPSRASDGRSP